MTTVLIKGGTVFDGTGRPGRRADVLLRDGVVADVADRVDEPGHVVDAAGAWVTPGFIDAHSHADLAALTGDGMALRARAGITTEVVGQDGFGLFPVVGPTLDAVAESLTTLAGPAAVTHTHATAAGYLAATRRAGFARVAALLPHSCLRAAVGVEPGRPADEAERARLAALARAELTDGVVGLSTGLSYPPARWADGDELVAPLSALPRDRRRFAVHLRDYGAGFADAVDEVVAIARAADASLHLSHFHVSGPGRAGSAATHLRRLDDGVTLDSYPYETGCTTLLSALPEWFQAADHVARRRILAGGTARRRLVADLDALGPGATFAVGWDGIVLVPRRPEVSRGSGGVPVAEAARALATTPGEVVAAVAAETGLDCFALARQGHRDNVLRVAAHPRHVVGSDGLLAGDHPPHPRAAWSFLRFLAWARDGVIPVGVPAMVAKMTGRTAAVLGLPGGTLTRGAPADVLVLDPARLSAGPEAGPSTPDAVAHSFLAGAPVIHDGRRLGRPAPLEMIT